MCMSDPAATQSTRSPAPQCVKEVYKLARSSGYEDAVWNRELKEARTRSGQSKLGISAADCGLGNDGAQVGYGEITAGGVEMLLRAFRELGSGNRAFFPLWSVKEALKLKSCLLTPSSRFLDIGSGLGKLVLHVALASGCRAAGVEILSSRVRLACAFKDLLLAQRKVPGWIAEATSFTTENAAAQRGPLLVDGAHATHVYMFSAVFSDHDLERLAARLNETRFKVLVCALKPKQERAFSQLDSVFKGAPVEVNMTGSGQRFRMCVFIKTSSL